MPINPEHGVLFRGFAGAVAVSLVLDALVIYNQWDAQDVASIELASDLNGDVLVQGENDVRQQVGALAIDHSFANRSSRSAARSTTTANTTTTHATTAVPPVTNTTEAQLESGQTTGIQVEWRRVKDLGVFEVTCYALPAKGSQGGEGSIAAPPNMPLGMMLEIGDDQEYHYVGSVRDRGGAIKGRRLDIWKPSDEECDEWGRRELSVWQIEPAA